MPSGWAVAVSLAAAKESHGNSGSAAPRPTRVLTVTPGSLVVFLRWQLGHDGVVGVDRAGLGCAARGSELVEEVDVGVVVLRLLLGQVILVVDGIHRTHR